MKKKQHIWFVQGSLALRRHADELFGFLGGICQPQRLGWTE